MKFTSKPKSIPTTDPLRETAEARFLHRLHTVMLVNGGLSCREVASIFNDSVRAVQSWVGNYRERGIEGLKERRRRGRPPNLADRQFAAVRLMIEQAQPGSSSGAWTGEALSALILEKHGIRLGIRQCQRYLKRFSSGEQSDS